MKRYNEKQSKRSEFAVSMLISAFILLYIYTILHVSAHDLVGVAIGGKVGKIVSGLNGTVIIPGTNFNNFTVSLVNIVGLLVPIIFFIITIMFYMNNHNSIFYNSFYFVASVGVIGSTLEWIIVPLISIFSTPPPGNDVTKFLLASNINPLVVSVGAMLLTLSLIKLVRKKGVFKRYFKITRSLNL